MTPLDTLTGGVGQPTTEKDGEGALETVQGWKEIKDGVIDIERKVQKLLDTFSTLVQQQQDLVARQSKEVTRIKELHEADKAARLGADSNLDQVVQGRQKLEDHLHEATQNHQQLEEILQLLKEVHQQLEAALRLAKKVNQELAEALSRPNQEMGMREKEIQEEKRDAEAGRAELMAIANKRKEVSEDAHADGDGDGNPRKRQKGDNP